MGKPDNLKIKFKIDRGLASYDISDHFAILGLPITTSPEQIRKKFLKLAKILHPDIFGRTDEEKETATQYYAKMVSPAYQILNSDRERGEYLATLRMFAQNRRQKQEVPRLGSELAQKLYQVPDEFIYKQYVEQIAPKQYESLDSILEYSAVLSELNLVYLFTQSSLNLGASNIASTPSNTSQEINSAPKAVQSPALRNLNMAELFISKKQWTDALKELIIAEKLDPNNAKVYALRGVAQMNQNANAIAKSSFQKALKLDPKEPTALKYLSQVNVATQPKAPEKASEKKGGIFGWGKK